MHVSLLNLFAVFICFYLAILLVLFLYQRNILYLPARNMGKPAEYGLADLTELTLTTEDNVRITTWYKPAPAGADTIIYFHGNAGHMGDRTDKFRTFADSGYGVLAISYRGYGRSEGTPTEQGIYRDARAVMKYAISQNIPLSSIIIFGESLGSGVGIHMATEFQIKALVLEAPYTSVTRRASEIYWYVPVTLLLKDKFDSLSKIKSVKSPLLILHGELDQTIPVIQGRELLAAANEPKKGVFYPDIHHVDFNSMQIVTEIRLMLQSLKLN